MEIVTGIGGFFFRSKDPAARWYEKHLGIGRVPAEYNKQPWAQEAGPTVFAPFTSDAGYFARTNKTKFRVSHLDATVTQRENVQVTIDPESYPTGRFTCLYDPEKIRSNYGKRSDWSAVGEV